MTARVVLDVPEGRSARVLIEDLRHAWDVIGNGRLRDLADQIEAQDARPLVVIDPEDREQVEALRDALWKGGHLDIWQDRLREFANPTPPKPEEPTDPRARVTDRRDNIWRLLADGDWVCTSGPDIGEYLAWSGLTKRGPLTVEVTQ